MKQNLYLSDFLLTLLTGEMIC